MSKDVFKDLGFSKEETPLLEKISDLQSQLTAARAEIDGYKLERELETLSNTKSLFRGTAVMKKYEEMETQLAEERRLRLKAQTLYGKAFQTARELMSDDAYILFVQMMDQAREALGGRSV